MEDNKKSKDTAKANDVSSYYLPSDEDPQIQGNTINVPDTIVLDEKDPNLADYIYVGGRCYSRDATDPSEEFEVTHENPVSGILENSEVTIHNPASDPSTVSITRNDVVLKKFDECGTCKSFSDRYRGQTLQTWRDFTIKVIKEEDSDLGDIEVYKLSGSDRNGSFALESNRDLLIFNNDSLTFDVTSLGDDKDKFSVAVGSFSTNGNKFTVGTSRRDPALVDQAAATSSSVVANTYTYSETGNSDATGGDLVVEVNPYEANVEYDTDKLKQYPHRVTTGGDDHTLLIKNDGRVFGAGNNNYFQLAVPRDRTQDSKRTAMYTFTESLMSDIGPVKKITGCHQNHGFLTYNNELYVAGRNDECQLGNNTVTSTAYPARVQIEHEGTETLELGADIHTRIVDAASGVYHSVALDINQRIWVWGNPGLAGAGLITTGSPSGHANIYTETPHNYAATNQYVGRTWDTPRISRARLAWWGTNDSPKNTAKVKTTDLFGHDDAKVVGVYAGYYNTYFLVDDGAVYSCGYNRQGQLGQDNVTEHHDIGLAANLRHNSFGKVKQTGGRGVGDRPANKGTGNAADWLTGAGNHWIKKMSAGARHVLMVDDNNILWGFGKNDHGQLGADPSTTAYYDKPEKIAENVYDAFAGKNSSAYITQSGDVYVSGYNANGKLGIDRYIDAPVPQVNTSSETITEFTKSTRLAGAVEVQMSHYHTTAVTSTGQVISLGENRYGMMGTRSELSATNTQTTYQKYTDKDTAVNANYLNEFGRDVKFRNESPTVLAGPYTTYLWYPDQDDDIKVAGNSDNYQAGYFNNPMTTVAKESTLQSISSTLSQNLLDGDKKIVKICPTFVNVHFINDAKELWSIGDNASRKLGNESGADSPTPVQPIFEDSPLENIELVAGGRFHTVAVDGNNRLFAWGNPGMTGNLVRTNNTPSGHANLYQASPYNYAATNQYVGRTWDTPNHNPFIVNDGHIRTLSDRVGRIKDVQCGRYNTYILNEDGELFSCGYNSNGELGQRVFDHWHDIGVGQGKQHLSFGQVFPSTSILDLRIVKVVAGDNHTTYAITEDNKLWGWGYNGQHQLGLSEVNDPSRTFFNKYSVPMFIADDVEDVFAGTYNTAFKKLSGEVYAMGRNENGQLANFGDGRGLGLDRHDATFGEKPETRVAKNPIPWFEASDGVLEVSFGMYHSIVKRVNRPATQIEWLSAGANLHGQCGNERNPAGAYPAKPGDPAGSTAVWGASDEANLDDGWLGSDKWTIIGTQSL